MQQYLDLLRQIKEKGTYKGPAREGMPGTLSLFGTQLRFNLRDGFPILTTKKVSFKNIFTELLWFMRGDTNIKYLVDNGCSIWNEDAYNYYSRLFDKQHPKYPQNKFTYEEWLSFKDTGILPNHISNYTWGDCGKIYGWLWRNWDNYVKTSGNGLFCEHEDHYYKDYPIDQLSELIKGLRTNPMSRRHIITAWNPTTLDDMAVNACHSMAQFNCRPLDVVMDSMSEPQYYLDCQLYQRSADVFLG